MLQIASNPTIEISLRVGAVSEQIQVEANTTMVETQSSGVGAVVDIKRVLDLPLIGRNVQDLVATIGAATNGSDGGQLSARNYPGIQAFSVAGGLATGTSYTLDGSMHNDVYTNSTLPLPFPDALQEFKVETSALPAQYGMHSGAAVNAVTKSGTNQYHGDLFEFVRNYKFNAKQRFAAARDSLKRNQWGGTIGGPILRNKLFFFAGVSADRYPPEPQQHRDLRSHAGHAQGRLFHLRRRLLQRWLSAESGHPGGPDQQQPAVCSTQPDPADQALRAGT